MIMSIFAYVGTRLLEIYCFLFEFMDYYWYVFISSINWFNFYVWCQLLFDADFEFLDKFTFASMFGNIFHHF